VLRGSTPIQLRSSKQFFLSEPSRHFRNKKEEYLKAKIDELETNSMIKNIRDFYRGINDFKMGYQPRNNIVNDVKGDLVTDCHSILEDLEDPGIDRRIILKWIFRKWDGGIDWIDLAQDGQMVSYCKRRNEPLGSIKCRESLE
jgi:hypothetical protein